MSDEDDIEERIRRAQERGAESKQRAKDNPDEAEKWGIRNGDTEAQGKADEKENPTKSVRRWG